MIDYHSLFRVGKNASMLLLGTMARMVASFLFVLYCADRLGVEGFGRYSISIHYFELFLSLTAAAVGIILTRDIARWPRHTSQLLTSAIILTATLCFVAAFILWCLTVLFGYSDEVKSALLIATVALLPASICTVYEAIFVTRERAEFVTAGIVLESLLRIGLSIWLLSIGYGLLSLMMVLVVSRSILMIAYTIGLLRIRAFGWRFHRRRSLRLVNRWRMFAAENWMASLYTNLDVILLSWLSGEAAAGIYSVAGKVVRLGTVVAKSYTTAVFPVMSRMYALSRESFFKLYRHTVRIMCALTIPAIAVVTVLSDRIIALLFSHEYSDAAVVLKVLIWGLLIDFLNPFLSHALFAQGMQAQSMRVAAISLAFNIISSYFWVLHYGAVGAALGTVLGGLIAMGCYLAFGMPKREILATAYLAMRVSLAATGLGLVVYFVRDTNWIMLAVITSVAYAPLLILVGAIRINDLRTFRTTFLVKAS